MSTPMMSAPSSARSTACERPWPRAMPVMKATFPSSLPMSGSPRRWCQPPGEDAGQGGEVEHERDARDVARPVGAEEQQGVGHLLGRALAADVLHGASDSFGAQLGYEVVPHHRGVDRARRDA